jgi:signal transduction histidine kinase
LISVVFRIVSTGLFVYRDDSSQIFISSVTGISCIPDIVALIVGGVGVKRSINSTQSTTSFNGFLISAAVILFLPLLLLIAGGIAINFVTEDWKIIVKHFGSKILEDILMVAAYASGIATEALTALILFLNIRSIRKTYREVERRQLQEREERRQRRQHQVSLVQDHQRARVGPGLVVPKGPDEEEEPRF